MAFWAPIGGEVGNKVGVMRFRRPIKGAYIRVMNMLDPPPISYLLVGVGLD